MPDDSNESITENRKSLWYFYQISTSLHFAVLYTHLASERFLCKSLLNTNMGR